MEIGFLALGLVQGSLAALNAVGLVLLWRTTRVVNLAQPAMGLVGGVLVGMLVSSAGWSFWWAAPVGVGVGAAAGLLSERLVMVRLAALPRVVPMVATLGLAVLFQALQSGIPFAFGGRLPSYDVDLGFELFVFPVLLKGPHLLALAALPVAVSGVHWYLHRSRLGVAAVATGQDLERAQALGIDPGFVRSVSWAIAGALSGVSGVLAVPVLGFSLGEGVGAAVLLLAFAPAVVVGLRDLRFAALAAVVFGITYQVALVRLPTAALADAGLAAVLLLSLALRRRPFDREAAAARSASWASATTPRRLPVALRRSTRWRSACAVAAPVAVAAAALPPLWLSPSGDVRYGTAGAMALAAVSVAVAWMFSGEIAIGHWGIAALGAAGAAVTPGPALVRALAAIAIGAVAAAALAFVSERRRGLSGAAAGLALALVAPRWLGEVDLGPRDGGGGAAVTAGAVAVAVAVAVTWFRSTRSGITLVAAHEEPRRAVDLGINGRRAYVHGLTLSGAVAGLAGALYLFAVPAGIAPGAFDAPRSFDILAFAVVGGLGSAIGAAAGAAALLAAGVLLPPPWGAVATGTGVLWVVLFLPSGLSVALTTVRDLVARLLLPEMTSTKPAPALRDAAGSDPDPEDPAEALPPGADTREAAAVPAVRRAAVAAFFVAAPAAASLVALPAMLDDHLGTDFGDNAAWLVLATAAIAVAAAAISWRRNCRERTAGSTDVVVVGGAALAALVFATVSDLAMVTVTAAIAAVTAPWVLARLAADATKAARRRCRSAAAGLVVLGAATGPIGALHLALVNAGGSLASAARWASLYGAIGTFAMARARAAARRNRPVASAAMTRAGDAGSRRRWAALRVESLSVTFGGTCVLEDVDLEVGAGEIVGLLGANGTGKSTLLRAVAGHVDADARAISVAGNDLGGLRADERAAAGVALVSGARPIFPELTVRENLRAAAYLTHRSARAFDVALRHVFDAVPSLEPKVDRLAGLLSGGEQRQLAIAQTLFSRPVVVLADEVALGLDATGQAAVRSLLRALAEDGVGVVVVDHDADALRPLADRFLVVHERRLHPVEPHDAALPGDMLAPRFLAGSSS